MRDLPPGFTMDHDGPNADGTEVGPGEAALDRAGDALAVTVQVETGLVLEEVDDTSGRHSLLPVTRSATYVLVPSGHDGWLVDDWEATFEYGQVRLVSGQLRSPRPPSLALRAERPP